MSKNRFISFRSQILNRKRPEDLIRIYCFMGEERGVYWVLVGRPEGKRPLGRPRCRWEDNINMELGERGIDGANWILLAQDRAQWRVFVRTVMNLRVPQRKQAI
jgi:hypothetical protein